MMKRLTALLLVMTLLTAAPALADWTCACGAANDGKFCTECGTAKPADDSWTCVCGKANTSKFCSSCGRTKDAANSCAACGYKPEGAAPKFCPSCGAPFGSAATVTAPDQNRTLRITEVVDIGDGSVYVAWEDSASGGPYTVYCCFGADKTKRQLGASDVQGTSATIYSVEPGMTFHIWVADGEVESEMYRLSRSAIADTHATYVYPRVKLRKLVNGVWEYVDSFSAAEIEAYKAANPNVDYWNYPYACDVLLDYKSASDLTVRMQAFLLTDTYNDVLVGHWEEATLPAGENWTLTDFVQLSSFFEAEPVVPGLYTFSLYFDGMRAGMGLFKITE